MKIDSYIDHSAPPLVVKKRFIDISRALNGGVEFGSPSNGNINMRGFWVDTITPGADVEFTVDHNLGYIPIGIIVVSVDKAAIVYASRKNQWTETQLFLKCNVATVSLQGFVI